jgi:hypothetical protein
MKVKNKDILLDLFYTKKESDFRNKIINIFRSYPLNIKSSVFNSIIRTSILKERIKKTFFVTKIADFGMQKYYYTDKYKTSDLFLIYDFWFTLYSNELNKYIQYKKEYENEISRGNYSSAREILNDINQCIGLSIWSCGQNLLINELEYGLKENKQTLEKFNKEINKNPFMNCILYFHSLSAEQNTSYKNYIQQIENFFCTYKTDVAVNYIREKLDPEYNILENDIPVFAQFDYQISIVDLYNGFVRLLPQILYNKELECCHFWDYINDDIVNNFKILTSQVSSVKNKEVYKLLECFIIDDVNISEVEQYCSEYFKINPNDYNIILPYIEWCGINKREPISNIPYYKLIYSLLTFDDNFEDSVQAIFEYAKKYKDLSIGSFMLRIVKEMGVKPNLNNFIKMRPMLCSTMSIGVLSYLSCENKVLNDLQPLYYQFIKSSTSNNIPPENLCRLYKNILLLKQQIINEEININDLDKYSNRLFELSENETNKYILSITSILFQRICESNKLFIPLFKNAIHIYLLNPNLFYYIHNSNPADIPEKIKNNEIKKSIYYALYKFFINYKDITKVTCAYSNYLDGNNYKSIYEVIDKLQNKNVNENNTALIAFLYHVCSVIVLKRDYRLTILNIKAEETRVVILNKLCECDHESAKTYMEEITSITTEWATRERLKQIDQGRITIGFDNIYKSNSNIWAEEFEKYLTIKKFDKDLFASDIFNNDFKTQISQNNDKILDVSASYALHQQSKILITNLANQIIYEFLFNTTNGLETYLSTRIRHGFCQSELTSRLSEYHLLSLKEHDADLHYMLNEYWTENYSSCPDLPLFMECLSVLTKSIDSLINEIRSKWFRIKFLDTDNGLFDYSSFPVAYSPDSGFNQFFDSIKLSFKNHTEELLNIIQQKIKNEFSTEYLNIVEKFEEQIKTISESYENVNIRREIIKNCIQARPQIEADINHFAGVFSLNNVNYKDYTMKDLVDCCKKIICKLNLKAELVDWDIIADDKLLIDGHNFPYMVDILIILLTNAMQHSGLNSTNLKIKIYAGVENNHESYNIMEKYIENKDFNLMKISVYNNLANDTLLDELKNKLRNIIENNSKEKTSREHIQTEGGSGLFKLFNIISNNIETEYSAGYTFPDNGICFTYCFNTEKLLVKESEYECAVS